MSDVEKPDAAGAAGRVPRHVAIIMDGNGRWAERRGLARSEGHAAGAKTLMRVADWCGARGVRHLTVYAFSTENWKRPKAEVAGLFRLLFEALRAQEKAFVDAGLRFRVLGRREGLPRLLVRRIERMEARTASFDRQLLVCFNYGGRAEIVDAANRAAARGAPVTEATFRELLYAPDVPDPDLIVRTGGERRVSNFLLWEGAYSEYHFSDVLWPDFSERDLDAALADYAGRQRRMGDVR